MAIDISIDNSAAAEDSAVVSATRARLLKASAVNTSGSLRYFMVFDASSLPGNGATPLFRKPVAASGGVAEIDLTNIVEDSGQGYDCTTGIVVALSSTAPTLTVTVASEGLFDVVYAD